jgi:hypothetical protein
MKRLGSMVSSRLSKVLKPLGLVAALSMVLVGAPGAAMAAGWRGGGGGSGHFGGGAVHAGVGFHGGSGWRGGGAVASPRYAQVPGGAFHKGYSPTFYQRNFVTARPGARVYVPGYWGWRGGARVWVGPTWAYPPSPGWVWVPARWVWNGFSWVWQNGYWAPPF